MCWWSVVRLAIVSPYVTTELVSESYYNVQAYGLSKALSAKGFSISVYTMGRKTDPSEKLLANTDGKVRIRYVRGNVRVAKMPLMNPRIVREIGEADFDIVQVTEDSTPTSLMMALAKQEMGANLVVFQGVYRVPESPLAKAYFAAYDSLFLPRVVRSVDMVIAKTTEAADFAVARGHDRVTTIPVGVDTDVFRPLDRADCRESLGLAQEDRVLLYVGKLLPCRDVETCILALREANKLVGSTKLFIVGSGPSLNELRRYADDLNVLEQVSWVGEVPNSRLPLIYSSADLTLLPMKRNTLFAFGMVISESLACGIPVVSVPVPAAVNHIAGNPVGVVVDFDNPDRLARTAANLLSDSARLASMSRAARTYACRELDWRVLAERYAETYESLNH